jgi:hypothetical protein
MSKFLFLLPLFITLTMNAESPAISFQSGPEKTALLELYTSEGCGSCPPAEKWLSGLTNSPALWKDFVPVAFHVDYWDRLGWRDPLSDRGFSDRQRDYAAIWHSGNIYTPEFVLAGKEWLGWPSGKNGPKPSGLRVGVLKVSSLEKDQWQITFQPAIKGAGKYEVYGALLTGGLSSDVKAGENRGRRLNHDFAVLNFVSVPMSRSGDTLHSQFVLPQRPGITGSTIAIAVWVTRAEAMEPLQATGGWVVRPTSDR